MTRAGGAILCLLLAPSIIAQPAVRPVPPPGIAVPAEDRAQLEASLQEFDRRMHLLENDPLIADARIYAEAARFALHNDGFYKPEEIARAKELLALGMQRLESLARKEAPWAAATGLVVRGYISRIDKSVQPYGLVIPPGFSPNAPHRWRLDTWFHGRGETLSEVNFLWDRLHNRGEFTPPGTIVLHLYGRYCNANKFAGEVDLFEALEAVKRQYAIDENRIVVRGFSMGGAAAWHIATHYAGLWAAAAPGAGFAETPVYLKIGENAKEQPTWWEKKLWHLYDATDYAANLYNCPVVAYSGEIDKQKQAADIMAEALAAEGMRLTHIIGPNTAHKYHPDSKVIINREIDALAARGRDPYPRKVRFTTWTLAYNQMKWVTIDGLEKHWERARLDAEILGDHSVKVQSANVTAFSLNMGPGGCPLDAGGKVTVAVDGQQLEAPGPMTDRSWEAHFAKSGGRWRVVDRADTSGIRKRHGLQGPIDDAFLDSFVMVRPTGKPLTPATGAWAEAEMQRAIREWRRQFRGEAQVKDDTAITDTDIAFSNLVLWGDPSSNRILARIAAQLPVRWTAEGLTLGGKKYPAATHAAILIYPNPLNPNRYVVLNSGITFREADYLSNARQVPRLPDWAIVDVTTPPDPHWPGKIADAGFFDESWK